MTPHPLTPLWQHVDAVLVINLDHRTDRWQEFLTNFGNSIPAEKLHRIPAIYGKNLDSYGKKPWFRGKSRDSVWAARGGCTLSHRKAIQFAQQQNWQNILILEDDAILNPTLSHDQLLASFSALFTNPNWQLSYLGFTSPLLPQRIIRKIPQNQFIAEISGANSSHAYILRPKAIQWLSKKLPAETKLWPWLAHHRAHDRFIQQHFTRFAPIYAVSSSLFLQSESYSDILQTQTNSHHQGTYQTHLHPHTSSLYPIQKFFHNQLTRTRYLLDIPRIWKKYLTGLS